MECSPRKSIYDMWTFMTVYSIVDDDKLHEILLQIAVLETIVM